MQIWSAAKTEKGQQLIEIEIAVVPGLPRVIVTGLPDQMIKESALRLKPIFRNMGLPWPKAKTIMFHLKPSDAPKSGNLLELAMAMGLLIKCGHMKWDAKHLIAMGSLNFDGSIEATETPHGLMIPEFLQGTPAWMNCEVSSPLFEIIKAQKLDALNDGCLRLPQAEWKEDTDSYRDLSGYHWPKALAEIAIVMASGGHSALLLGSAGIGKSTFARLVHRCLPEPSEQTAKEIQLVHQRFQMRPPLRPFVAPHHLSTAKTLVGGYHRLGEIHRAHGGVLCLDELFEFPMEVQDSLREPAENKQMMRIAHASLEMLPCDFLLIGTSNLCKCGRLGIGATDDACNCSRAVKRSGLNRFSGPLMDRFDMIVHCDSLKPDVELVALEEILGQIRTCKNPMAEETPLPPVEIPSLYLKLMNLHRLSRRRAKSFERVCQTLASVRGQTLQASDFEWAFDLTVNSYNHLQQLRKEL
ncbi:MAG: ATP-binding protein [Bdellovibrionales bacterium]|nr:ATP-binding protein [Bdellovibrionales bacterium]